MSLFNFLVTLHHFIYSNKASYIAILLGLIRMTNKLSYSQTEKLGSPDLKVGQLLHPNFYEHYSTSWWVSTTLCIQINLPTSRFILVWLEERRSYHIPKQESWDHVIWKWDSFFFILTHMSLFNFLVSIHYFMYPNKISYITIHPGLIRMTIKLSYSQTEKLGSPDLKVG